jgi:hypothetical protein
MTTTGSHDSLDRVAGRQAPRPDELEDWLTGIRVNLSDDPRDWLTPEDDKNNLAPGLSAVPLFTPTLRRRWQNGPLDQPESEPEWGRAGTGCRAAPRRRLGVPRASEASLLWRGSQAYCVRPVGRLGRDAQA